MRSELYKIIYSVYSDLTEIISNDTKVILIRRDGSQASFDPSLLGLQINDVHLLVDYFNNLQWEKPFVGTNN